MVWHDGFVLRSGIPNVWAVVQQLCTWWEGVQQLISHSSCGITRHSGDAPTSLLSWTWLGLPSNAPSTCNIDEQTWLLGLGVQSRLASSCYTCTRCICGTRFASGVCCWNYSSISFWFGLSAIYGSLSYGFILVIKCLQSIIWSSWCAISLHPSLYVSLASWESPTLLYFTHFTLSTDSFYPSIPVSILNLMVIFIICGFSCIVQLKSILSFSKDSYVKWRCSSLLSMKSVTRCWHTQCLKCLKMMFVLFDHNWPFDWPVLTS